MDISKIKLHKVDQVGLIERTQRFKARSIKKEAKVKGLHLALSMIDLTTLEGRDTEGKVNQLCYKAIHMHDRLNLPNVAAVCVYPNRVQTAVKALKGSGVKVASVATGFPSGMVNMETKLADTKMALDAGADEIDMVIPRDHFHMGNYSAVYDQIAEIKALCKNARLKVILETGELGTADQVRLASDIAILAGADFIKTSTGKISPAATMPVTLLMLEAIKDHYLKTGKMVGMKPAGGISDSKTALQYLVMLNETLGEKWMNNEWFRFGASRLANDIVLQLLKQEKGNYQSLDYIAKD